MKTILYNSNQVVTCRGKKSKKGSQMSDIGLVENGSIVIEDGKIIWVGETEELQSLFDMKKYNVIDCKGKVITPGYVDSHTHLVFGGNREDEYAMRLKGASYMEIMEMGGGINNTVNATRHESEDFLYEKALKRLDSFLRFGVTTVESKSGYGLDFETEIKQLNVNSRINENHKIDVVSTYMGAHSIPEEYKGREDEYVDYMIDEVLPYVVKEDLASFCDIFCEKNVFTIEQSRRLLLKAKEMGLGLKIHADEIFRLGGAELAAELSMKSADHLLKASDEGLRAMNEKNVVATLLPITAFSLKEEYARGRFIIDNGGAVAIATDYNPGSCHSHSIPLMIALSTIYMGLTIEEVLNALTINAAAALGIEEHTGSIENGKFADILLHDCPNYKHISYNISINTVEKVIKKGEIVYNRV